MTCKIFQATVHLDKGTFLSEVIPWEISEDKKKYRRNSMNKPREILNRTLQNRIKRTDILLWGLLVLFILVERE